MTAITSDDLDALRDGATRFAADALGAARLRALRDSADGVDRPALARLGADGWLSMLAPESRGGMEQGLAAACAAATAFGRAFMAVPFAGAAASLAIAAALAPILGEELLARAIRGEALILPALDFGESRVRARIEAGEVRLDGMARGVHGANAADVLLIEARLDDAAVLVVAPRAAAGLRVVGARLVDGAMAADVVLEDCRAPASHVLRDRDALARVRAATGLLCAAELVGLMEIALERTVEHLKTRTQFGRPLGSFQALQFRAVDAYIALACARALTGEAARLVDEAGGGEAIVSAAKAKASEAAREVARAMVQLHGAMGFTDEHDIGLCLKRALALGAAWGTAAHHRGVVAASRAPGESFSFREDSADDAAFRAEARAWLEENLPARLRHLPTRPSFEDACWWHRKLAERGWVAPNWPKRHGGMEASVARQIILIEEFGAIGAPEISGQAINHLGPILQVFGTEEQKARHLPGMLSGDVIWCQGYSEPGAGSDLASLRTRATRDGDDFIVNGSKIWTTWGHYADWMFALVRTNPDVKKQMGITFLLIDMKTPGLTRRPIETIAGDDEFSEVFLDDVRVPVSNVVGAIDDGWRVATALLEKERLNGANPRKCADILSKIKCVVGAGPVDPALADRLTRAEIEYAALCAIYARVVVAAETGGRPSADFAFAKLVNAELQQTLCELLVESLGARGALAEPIDFAGEKISSGITYLQSRRTTIHGGTAEIQRGLIARRVLSLS